MTPKPKVIRSVSESYLKPGMEVEITSNETGMQGSLYTGTVIRRCSSKNTENYLVEYKNLFADESGMQPLREILHGGQIRPVAPRETNRKFKFAEEVDAYYNDGWWEGTITIDHGNGRFSVFFRKSREQIEFGTEDLRLHRELVNGVWIPPLEKEENELLAIAKKNKVPNEDQLKANKTIAEFKYRDGTTVEVSSDDEGFQGAWFSATIIKPCGNKKYMVEYKTLRSDEDTEFLKEEVDVSHIRPTPPEKIVVGGFEKFDKVEAWYNDGWWEGVISKVLTNSKYMVYFKSTDEHIKYHHSNLRMRQDWINGEWVL